MKVLGVELPKSYRRKVYGGHPVVGVDVESLVTGYAFVVCDSAGRCCWIRSFDDVRRFFDHEEYEHCLMVAFNLNFDASVMLKWLGEVACTKLIEDGYVSVRGCMIRYVPSKFLQFRFGNRYIRMFDVAQFFQGSLDFNAKQYLGVSKIDVGSKRFTEMDYGRQDILNYCTHDALLTMGLGDYVVDAFDKLGVKISGLASPASIVESYILDQRLIRNDVECVPQMALEFAMHSFSGAWFENFKAGYFPKTFRYDLVSAYPSVIRDLVDLSMGYWVESTTPPKDALYGWAHANVWVPQSYVSPIVFKNVRGEALRPYGSWDTYITLPELKWARAHGARFRIYEGVWFVPDRFRFMYRDVVDKFFKVKRDHPSESMEAWSAKIALTGIYGKFLQHRDGQGGRLYNPIYATEITSRVRLMVADAALSNPEALIAVMSDCVISQEPVKLPVGREMGMWSRRGPDASLWIGPAQYEAEGRDHRFRRIPWLKLLKSDPNLGEYEVVRNGPLTLVQGVKLHRFEDVGVFHDVAVTFDIRKLNWRRFWPRRPKNGNELLLGQYDSRQLSVTSRLRDEDLGLWAL